MPCVLESRSAGQRALAPPTDGHPPDFRTIQTLHNHFPNHPATAFQPRPNHRKPQPFHNRPSAARRTIPRLTNIHDSTILRVESKNDSDSTIPHPIFSNHNSTTRKRIREAAAESSSSCSLGEYAVSIRSDFRSTASLPPRPQHTADATRRYPTLISSGLQEEWKLCYRSPVTFWRRYLRNE